MATSINVREELAQARIGTFHLRFAVLVAFIMFFDGYDLFNAAYVIPLVRHAWQPTPAMIGMMLSSGIVGLSIGYQRDLAAVSATAQAIIDRVGAERDAALAECRRLRAALATAQGELEVARFQARRRALHA